MSELRGLADAYAELGRVPTAAHDELGVELAIIGREILGEQQALVPKDTGHLDGGLSLSVLVDRLKLRVGLLRGMTGGGKSNGRTRRKSFGGYYYGRFVNFGRRAQTVVVTRIARRIARTARGRKNRGARKAIVLANSYTMKVKAMAPTEFIHVPGAEATALGQLAEFWRRTLDRARGAA